MLRAVARAAALLGVALAAAMAARPAPARAHTVEVARAEVVVGEREISLELGVSLLELDLLLGLDRDGDGSVDGAEVEAARPRLLEYLRAHVWVTSGGAPLAMGVERLRPVRGGDGRSWLEAGLRFRGETPLGEVAIRCEPLVELGSGHRTLARVERGASVEQFVFSEGVAYRAGATTLSGRLARLLRLGVLHIFTGYDHVLFLLGLLLASAGLREIVKVVTSFTLAHSVTLSFATLGWLSLPPRLVEAGIAASIAYVALENLLRRGPARRWLLSLGFGLLHGFGFASALTELRLPRAELAASLLGFNLGVELGQLAIVLAALPFLSWLRRSPVYRPVLASTSAAMLVVGVLWLYQRAL